MRSEIRYLNNIRLDGMQKFNQVSFSVPVVLDKIRNDHPNDREKLYGLRDFAVYFVA